MTAVTAAAAAAAAAQLPGLRPDQVARAVASLLKHAADQRAKAAGQLFDDDEFVYVTVALKRSPAPHGALKVKPVRIAVPHPLFTVEGAEVCLFVKDSKGDGHKAAKARLAKFTAKGGVNKIVGLSKLRTKYESHEAKRQLCGSYDLFLADERVLPSLPKLIGKSFFKKKKVPIPIDIRAASFPDAVRRAVEESTFMSPPAGSCVTVRAARSGMGAAAVVDNVLAVLVGVVGRIPKKWANVQAVYLKTSESVALPVYQTLPDKPVRIEGAAAADEEGGSEEGAESSEEEEEVAEQQQRGKGKGKGAAAAAAKQQTQKPAPGGRRRH
jgi:ribosome biogenesis protein UTP30